MFDRYKKNLNLRRFDRAIAGVLETAPLKLQDAPWCTVSMVANRDVPMYLTAIKSFYPHIGDGKVVAIVDRAMPQPLRDTLSRHVVGLEFVTLEDIPTEPCQRGGTWERLLYCLDRSVDEFTIQLDCDTLAVSDDLSAVVACLHANRAFTMSDGFVRMSLPEAAELARATPSNYIGIAAEAAFGGYPGAERLHYIRGSSGFAGFAKGGYTRAEIAAFHQTMEGLVGVKRWREWGSEQCGSNFAIANSPDPLVLPYPDYSSFTERVLRDQAKLFHFIGKFRFKEDYFARRSQEVIARLTPGAAPVVPPPPHAAPQDSLPMLFARHLTPATFLRYVRWRLSGRSRTITVQMKARSEFQGRPGPGPLMQLRPLSVGNNDPGVAYDIFVHTFLMPPVWFPPERVKLIVDLGANVGMSCLWWLSNYWRAHVIAFEPHPAHAAQARANIALNGYGPRIELHQAAVGAAAGTAWITDEATASHLSIANDGRFQVEVIDLLSMLRGRRIDILKVDIEGSEVGLLEDPRFKTLDVGAIIMEWHKPNAAGQGGREWCIGKLQRAGFRTYVTVEQGAFGMVWAYRDRPAAALQDDALPTGALAAR